MIIAASTSTDRSRPRTAAWIAAILVLPLGIVHCGPADTPAVPDEEATEAPVAAEAGDAAQEGDAAANEARRQARVVAFRQQVHADLEAGKITEEEAAEKFAQLRRRIAPVRAAAAAEGAAAGDANENARGAGMRARYEAAVAAVQAKLDAGEITEEEAREQWDGLRRRLAAASRERGSGNEGS